MEVRKDYLLERYVYFAPERKKRVKQFKKEETAQEGICFFCPGNESLTPAEIGRVEKNGRWLIRWFPNKFPAVELKKGKVKESGFLNKRPAYGMHEVIAETPDHKKQMWDLPAGHIKKILEIYKLRMRELTKLKGIKYVQIFKNHGRGGGTSLIHSHTQVAAIDRIPPLVQEEANAAGKFKKKSGKCPYCSIIKAESRTERKCFENRSMIVIAPYASRYNFETWIFPKRHVGNITELSEDETKDLADMLKRVLLKLRKLNVSYNFFLHYFPNGNDLHFHIEVCPRIATWAGFELSTEMIINSVMPEDAAKFFQGKNV